MNLRIRGKNDHLAHNLRIDIKKYSKEPVEVGNPKVVIFIINTFRQSRAYAELPLSLTFSRKTRLYFVTNQANGSSREFGKHFITISLALLRIFWCFVNEQIVRTSEMG